jgi:DNA-binding NarL/FixJ family response regulator
MTCFLAWGAALLLLPVIVLLYMTASPQQHAKRLRAAGHTYKSIATRLNVSATTARKYALA